MDAFLAKVRSQSLNRSLHNRFQSVGVGSFKLCIREDISCHLIKFVANKSVTWCSIPHNVEQGGAKFRLRVSCLMLSSQA